MVLRIKWSNEATDKDGKPIATDSFGLPLVHRAIRRSPNYIKLADWLVKHPEEVRKGFRPRDLGTKASALQTYRADVENWLVIEMVKAIAEDPQWEDGTLRKEVLKRLHRLPWDDDTEERGFFAVAPCPAALTPTRVHAGYGLQTMAGRDDDRGLASLPHLKARGIGIWAEPDIEDDEKWHTRLVLNSYRASVNRLADAYVTGQHIGALGPIQLRRAIEGMTGTAMRILPQAPDERPAKKALPAAEP